MCERERERDREGKIKREKKRRRNKKIKKEGMVISLPCRGERGRETERQRIIQYLCEIFIS